MASLIDSQCGRSPFLMNSPEFAGMCGRINGAIVGAVLGVLAAVIAWSALSRQGSVALPWRVVIVALAVLLPPLLFSGAGGYLAKQHKRSLDGEIDAMMTSGNLSRADATAQMVAMENSRRQAHATTSAGMSIGAGIASFAGASTGRP